MTDYKFLCKCSGADDCDVRMLVILEENCTLLLESKDKQMYFVLSNSDSVILYNLLGSHLGYNNDDVLNKYGGKFARRVDLHDVFDENDKNDASHTRKLVMSIALAVIAGLSIMIANEVGTISDYWIVPVSFLVFAITYVIVK